METQKGELSILSERYVPFILITLFLNGETRIGQFSDTITNLNTLKNAVKALRAEGLVDCRRETKPHRTTYLALTDKGWEVAKALHVAEQLRSGERGAFE